MWQILIETIFFLAISAALGILIGYIVAMIINNNSFKDRDLLITNLKKQKDEQNSELLFVRKDLQRTENELLTRENKNKILQADVTVLNRKIQQLENALIEKQNQPMPSPPPSSPTTNIVDEEKYARLLERFHNVLRERELLIDQLEEYKKKEAGKPKEAPDQSKFFEELKQKALEIDFDIIGTAHEDERDDLQLIKGIGPFIEKKLNALGIYTFAQISKFDDEIAETVNEAIEFFPGRIIRDDWKEQAKNLIKKYYKS